jgi:hypothetical protein
MTVEISGVQCGLHSVLGKAIPFQLPVTLVSFHFSSIFLLSLMGDLLEGI